MSQSEIIKTIRCLRRHLQRVNAFVFSVTIFLSSSALGARDDFSLEIKDSKNLEFIIVERNPGPVFGDSAKALENWRRGVSAMIGQVAGFGESARRAFRDLDYKLLRTTEFDFGAGVIIISIHRESADQFLRGLLPLVQKTSQVSRLSSTLQVEHASNNGVVKMLERQAQSWKAGDTDPLKSFASRASLLSSRLETALSMAQSSIALMSHIQDNPQFARLRSIHILSVYEELSLVQDFIEDKIGSGLRAGQISEAKQLNSLSSKIFEFVNRELPGFLLVKNSREISRIHLQLVFGDQGKNFLRIKDQSVREAYIRAAMRDPRFRRMKLPLLMTLLGGSSGELLAQGMAEHIHNTLNADGVLGEMSAMFVEISSDANRDKNIFAKNFIAAFKHWVKLNQQNEMALKYAKDFLLNEPAGKFIADQVPGLTDSRTRTVDLAVLSGAALSSGICGQVLKVNFRK